jgi:hypothetical protein
MNSNETEMFLALVGEVGELVDSFGAFSWKVNTRDDENIKMELVDIVVFAINLAFYTDKLDKPEKVYNEIDTEKLLVEVILSRLMAKDYLGIVYSIAEYMPEVMNIITAKQALNQLRQDYGYKTGDYQKIWNGNEDNVYLRQFYSKDYDEVYEGMEKLYLKHLDGVIINVFN